MTQLGFSPNGIDSQFNALANLEPKTDAHIQRVAQEFEGVFLSLLVKQMRQTVGENGLLGSESTDSLGGLFDLHMGKTMAQTQPLGIAKLWVDQYQQNAEHR